MAAAIDIGEPTGWEAGLAATVSNDAPRDPFLGEVTSSIFALELSSTHAKDTRTINVNSHPDRIR